MLWFVIGRFVHDTLKCQTERLLAATIAEAQTFSSEAAHIGTKGKDGICSVFRTLCFHDSRICKQHASAHFIMTKRT